METEKETCTRPKWMTKLLGCSFRDGGIPSNKLPRLLSEVSPGLNVDEAVVNRLISQNNPNGSDVLDFDTVTKIVFQLILKQPCIDTDEEESVNLFHLSEKQDSDCCCAIPGSCSSIKVTDFIIFPTF